MNIINVTQENTATWLLESDKFSCQHDGNVVIKNVEIDTMRNGEHDTYMGIAAVCEDCEEEQDPDQYIDNERGDN